MSLGQTLLVAGIIWTLALLALAAMRFFKLAPPIEGAWPWPVWIAISSPFAAALLPLHAFLFAVVVTRGDFALLGALILGPLLLLSVAGLFGLMRGMPK